jgi:hypothetical protein
MFDDIIQQTLCSNNTSGMRQPKYRSAAAGVFEIFLGNSAKDNRIYLQTCERNKLREKKNSNKD